MLSPFHKVGLGLLAAGGLSLIATLFFLSPVTTLSAEPASAPDNECDAIAALHLPYSSTTAVHERTEPDWPRGVTVCEAEVREHPGEIRFVYQLGRA
jgi:hypothetical protein